ncbi:MAG: phosphotransferase [Nocardioides sp.]
MGRTAQRLEWRFLPAPLRAAIEERCGAAVVGARSQGAGYTPGFASVLDCADGSRHFVKAAARAAQRPIADAYLEEARKLGSLPESVPTARLRWLHEDDGWVALGLQHLAGRAPRRPWVAEELGRCLDALEQVSRTLTPVPPELELSTVAEDLGPFASAWEFVASAHPDLPHREEAAALAADFLHVCGGDTVVHTDVRDDNVLLGADGEVWLCDWNWLARGAPWLDTVFLLLVPWGDGVDVEAIMAERELTCDLPAAHVDATLALLTGFFMRQSAEPVPPTSPYLRQHQAWCAEATWGWLSSRRGWT